MSDATQGHTLTAVQRFLDGAGLVVSAAELFADPDRQRMSALCYIEHRGRVLMLRRRKPPFEGHWTAPGGKLQPGEDPAEAIRREVAEETGLEMEHIRLRLIASETGPEHYNWLLFFFRGTPQTADVDDALLSGPRDSDEGELDWLLVEELPERPLPGVEKRLLPYIFPRGDGEGGMEPERPGEREREAEPERAAEPERGEKPGRGEEPGPYFARIRFGDDFEVETMDVRPLLGD